MSESPPPHNGNSGNRPDRPPPQAPDIEMAVLGAMMMDRDAVDQVMEILDETSFYRGPHQKIFRAVGRLMERSETPDYITVSEELKKTGDLESAGGVAYLTECYNKVTSAANVEYHARLVLEKSVLRGLIDAGTTMIRESREAREDPATILDNAEARIFSISEARKRKGFEPIKKIVIDALEMIDSYHKRKGVVTGVPTGFTELDKMTSGFQPSDLILVAGRPSMGKTAFCLNIARYAAGENIPVGIFSLEMSSLQLALRLLCSEARIDQNLMRTGRLAEKQWRNIAETMGDLAEAPLFIDDTPGMSVLEVRAKARRLKREHNIGMIIIDYLQLMRGPTGSDGRQQEVAHISRSLKALAKELNIPVVALSQLSRAPEARGGDKKPMLSDLRESGALEQDADLVMFIHRSEMYSDKQDEMDEGAPNAEIIIGKQRNGPVGTIHLSFIKAWTRFENPAPSYYGEDYVPETSF